MRIFRHTRLDALLVGLSILEVALRTTLVIAFVQCPVWLLAVGLIVLVLLNGSNYQCAGHYCIHSPYFAAAPLNSAFSILNSLALLAPQSLYKIHHLNHHRYGNDFCNETVATTQDRSSTYRYETSPHAGENPWRYALLSPLRQELAPLMAEIHSPGERWQLAIESSFIAGYIAAIVWHAPATGIVFGAVSIYLGMIAAAIENWAEHAGAMPGSRLTDAVSCYGWFYNAVWFNNGYHQEHHYRPSVHWTRLPSLRKRMLPDTKRRVVPLAHLANILGRGRVRV
jgi:fatty acid desaturase